MEIIPIEHISFDGCELFVTRIEKSQSNRRANETSAVDRLLSQAFNQGARLGHRPSGAPYIIGTEKNISISQSRDYASLAVSKIYVPGVDVEQPREQLWHVAARILSEEELDVYGSSMELLLRAWTLKEAIYKAALTEGLDFRADIHLPLDLTSDLAKVKTREFKILTIDQTPTRSIALTCAI